ncbi:DUF4197 domain-containing protein [Undibacterium luofuense]|uniref:DUF4197 domain-containing protein n=1 Tax=Undibacterium luofuense TaxID=2828733 RepID=UPI0030EF017C
MSHSFNDNEYMKQLLLATLLASFIFASHSVSGAGLSDLSNQETSVGLKAALEKGAGAAVGQLGKENGFLSNEKVKIRLPSTLEKIRPVLQMTGKSGQLDELVIAMNRAAEAAVPKAKPLLMNAVKSMTISDAKNILTGGDTSVTEFFRQKTSSQLGKEFLPVVKSVTDKSGLSSKYNNVMAQVQKFGVVDSQESTVEGYVTERALDALFVMIGEEEKAIRKDPLGAGSKAISKVFSLLN